MTDPSISVLRARIGLSCIRTTSSQMNGYCRANEIPTPRPHRERNHTQPRQTWSQQCHRWQARSVDEFLAKRHSEHIWVTGLGDELSDEAEIICRVRKRLRTSGPVGGSNHHRWISSGSGVPMDVRLRQILTHHPHYFAQTLQNVASVELTHQVHYHRPRPTGRGAGPASVEDDSTDGNHATSMLVKDW